jgi:hypothetical protein
MGSGTILVVVWKGEQFSHCYGKKNNSRCYGKNNNSLFEKENNMTSLFIFYGKENNSSVSGLRKGKLSISCERFKERKITTQLIVCGSPQA